MRSKNRFTRWAIERVENIVGTLRVWANIEPPVPKLDIGELDHKAVSIFLGVARSRPVLGQLSKLRGPTVSATWLVRNHHVGVTAITEVGLLTPYRELHLTASSKTAPPRVLESVCRSILQYRWDYVEWEGDTVHYYADENYLEPLTPTAGGTVGSE